MMSVLLFLFFYQRIIYSIILSIFQFRFGSFAESNVPIFFFTFYLFDIVETPSFLTILLENNIHLSFCGYMY